MYEYLARIERSPEEIIFLYNDAGQFGSHCVDNPDEYARASWNPQKWGDDAIRIAWCPKMFQLAADRGRPAQQVLNQGLTHRYISMINPPGFQVMHEV